MQHRVFDRTLGVYTLISVGCWCVGTALMFLLYNALGFSYWAASACNYLVGGTIGYLLNRKYTFHYRDDRLLVLAKYVVHMVICYFAAYSLALPLANALMEDLHFKIVDNVSMAIGSVLFSILNYFGQRYVVFRRLRRKK